MTDDQLAIIIALKDERAAIDGILADPTISTAAFELVSDFPRETATLLNLATPIMADANTAWTEALNARRAEIETHLEAITVDNLPTS